MEQEDSCDKTRRRLLQTTGAIGIAGLAGCSGGTNDSNTTTSTAGTTESTDGTTESSTTEEPESKPPIVDSTFTHAAGSGDLTSKHYNPYNWKEYQGSPSGYIFDPYTAKNDFTGEYYPYLIEDWTVTKDAMELTVRDGIKWWDGSKVDARDVTTQLKLDFNMYGFPETVGGVSVKDERTARLELTRPANARLLKTKVLGKTLSIKHDVFKKFLEKFEDATTDEAKQKAKNELSNAKIDEPYGHGIFKYDRVNKSKITLKKNPDHPDVDAFNIPKVEFIQMGGGNQKQWAALQTGNLDGTKAFIDSTVEKSFPDWLKSKKYPAHWGLGLWPNRNDPVLKKRNVRKALAYVFDRMQIAKNSDSTKEPVEMPAGVTNSVVDKWVGDVKDDLNPYHQNHEKAAELLKKEGFTKKNGTWYEPNGNKFALPVNVPAGWSDWILSVQTIVAQLKDFGIPSEVKTTPGSSYLGSLWPSGNFRLATYGWAAGRAYPYFTYELTYANKEVEGAISLPETIEVPPLGEPDGEPRKVLPAQKIGTLEKRLTDSTEKSLVQELAWVYNQDLPCIPIQEKTDQAWYNVKEWEYPSNDDKDMATYDQLFTWLPRQGKLSGKPK